MAEAPRRGHGRLVRHGPLALGLLCRLNHLQTLLEDHSFWARGRRRRDLGRMVLGSQAVVSAWCNGSLVGFGRATSDGVFRAVLWDVVVAGDHRGRGLGRRIVAELLTCPPVLRAQRVYLMTTDSAGFYQHLGFSRGHGQQLLMLDRRGQLSLLERNGRKEEKADEEIRTLDPLLGKEMLYH
jgi:N-acetylglutamate synthase-like GNAT family acetyltransferase